MILVIENGSIRKLDTNDFDYQKRLVNFLALVQEGNYKFHITNGSLFNILAGKRVVAPGGALCGRQSNVFHGEGKTPTCPGCIAQMNGLVGNKLTETVSAPEPPVTFTVEVKFGNSKWEASRNPGLKEVVFNNKLDAKVAIKNYGSYGRQYRIVPSDGSAFTIVTK